MRSAAPRPFEENRQHRRGEPGWRPGRAAVWGRPARLGARLIAWPTLVLLGATFATAACLVGDCPISRTIGAARPLATLEGSDGASIRSLTFAADGSALVSLDESGAIELRRPPAARRGIHPRPAATSGPSDAPFGRARSMALSPGGNLLAVAHLTGAAALYRLHGRSPRAPRAFELGPGTLNAAALAFSPDGQTLAVGQGDGLTTLWNVADGSLRATFDTGPSGPPRPAGAPASRAFVTALAFSPDGRALAAAGGDRHVRIRSLADGRLVEDVPTPAGACIDLAFSPDGRTLAIASPTAAIVHLWGLAEHRPRAALHGTDGPVHGLAISPDGRTLAAAGLEGRIDCWDLQTLRRLPVRLEHPGAHAIAFAPDGHALATGGFDGAIKLWKWR